VSAALQTIISDWAVPRMNVRVLKSSAFVGNHGSVGVFRKCGFELETTIEKGSVVLSEARGGGRRDIHVFKWERE
jgi:RimJ/RimL family protein N-acetyltransferase